MPTANGVMCRTRVGAGHPRWMWGGCPTLTAIGVGNLSGDGPGSPLSLGAGRLTTTGFGSCSEAGGVGGPMQALVAEQDSTEAAVSGILVVRTSCLGVQLTGGRAEPCRASRRARTSWDPRDGRVSLARPIIGVGSRAEISQAVGRLPSMAGAQDLRGEASLVLNGASTIGSGTRAPAPSAPDGRNPDSPVRAAGGKALAASLGVIPEGATMAAQEAHIMAADRAPRWN
jgi:hypothetical protein